jgi:hypothetical protein
VHYPESTMRRILLSASFPESTFARQTPGNRGRWDEFQFLFSSAEALERQPLDGWVVYDDLKHPLEQLCPRNNTLLITGEPACVRRYRNRFTSQFGQVWTAQSSIKHRHVTYGNEGQPWHYAMHAGEAHGHPLGYDELAALAPPPKTKLLSVICSSKTVTPDHRKRLEFVRFLQAQLGDSIDVFGRGIRSISDKSDAIWPYKYHIVLENDHCAHFMTEKISDAFLGWSYPIYFGGPEIYNRYPPASFSAIDIYQPEQALATIQALISSQHYEATIPHIAAARQAVLTKNNLMSMLADYWRDHLAQQSATRVSLVPKSHRASLLCRQLGRSVVGTWSQRAA